MNPIKNMQDLNARIDQWFGESGNQTVHVEYVERAQWDRLFVMLHKSDWKNTTITNVTIEIEHTLGTAIFIILNP